VLIACYERLRVDSVRRGGGRQADDLARQVEALEKRLAALRQWPLRRYSGDAGVL
jgi:hypothetical protein